MISPPGVEFYRVTRVLNLDGKDVEEAVFHDR
jgi:hypothetical protein